jgi:lipopolysaccharide transport system ATP-binding protein
MSEIVIDCENVSKLYRLGEVNFSNFKDDLSRIWSSITGDSDPAILKAEENDRTQKNQSDYVWALKDINFKVTHGEVVGLIGRNGAGKSTLLKILSKVTAPSTGSIKIKGRVASLLEVGTGFHPELSGKENIYLNGHILGMTKKEIDRKFDEIVDFAGVERYLDTPVKRYSSGMYVRLAFAVAAHLEPDILIVDEVLAVGDADFQKKCLGKMRDVSKSEGRTILFVSHNMAAVQSICSHAVVLKNGTIAAPKQDTKIALQYYHQSIIGGLLATSLADRTDRSGNGYLQFTSLQFLDENMQQIQHPVSGNKTFLRLTYKLNTHIRSISVAVGFNSTSGESKFIVATELVNTDYTNIQNDGHFDCVLEKFPLAPGEYLVNIFSKMEGGEIVDWIQEATNITVENGDFFGTGKNITTNHQSVLVEHKWI